MDAFSTASRPWIESTVMRSSILNCSAATSSLLTLVICGTGYASRMLLRPWRPLWKNLSASDGLDTVMPHAPFSSCIAAISSVLWVFTCGRSCTWLASASCCMWWTLWRSRASSTITLGVTIHSRIFPRYRLSRDGEMRDRGCCFNALEDRPMLRECCTKVHFLVSIVSDQGVMDGIDKDDLEMAVAECLARAAMETTVDMHSVPEDNGVSGGAQKIVNSSAYGFCVFSAEELPALKAKLLECATRTMDNGDEEIRGTILLSEEGVNIRLSGTSAAVDCMKTALRSLHPDLRAMVFKDSYSERLTLPRLLVKVKKEVISMGDPSVKPAVDGLAEHISPEEFKAWMDEDRDMVILDTRNDYEVRLGTFEKAIDLNIKSFRAFPSSATEHLKDVPKDKPVVMFCTGGVRCEKAAYTLINDGRKAVYQLDGGILQYFERVGGAHYKGDCYIFDDRVALTPELREGSEVACFTCRSPLTLDEQSSSDFVPGKHCQYCKHGKPDIRQ